ncbi:MAG: hypothetical protein WC828_05170 [Thermoleophilia bacterium]|jgi:hypothetical protein
MEKIRGLFSRFNKNEKKGSHMLAEIASKGAAQRYPLSVKVACSWCGSFVPLPSGDFCGVCIDCGTVMFRDPGISNITSHHDFEQCIKSMEESIASQIGRSVPVPAL